MTMRPLPRPVTTAECYLAAVVDRLDALASAVEELSGRLGPSSQPPPGQEDEEATMRLLEPDTGPATEPVRLREPDVSEPPRYGKGSGRDVWAAYADRLGVRYPPDAGQRQIIAAVDAVRAEAA